MSSVGYSQYFSAPALGIPGVDPAGRAIRVSDRLAATGMDRRYLGVDRLYPFQKVEKWHQPISKLGRHTVHDYRIDQLGIVGTIGGVSRSKERSAARRCLRPSSTRRSTCGPA